MGKSNHALFNNCDLRRRLLAAAMMVGGLGAGQAETINVPAGTMNILSAETVDASFIMEGTWPREGDSASGPANLQAGANSVATVNGRITVSLFDYVIARAGSDLTLTGAGPDSLRCSPNPTVERFFIVP